MVMISFTRGFTLVELMVVISVIGILSVIVYANVGSASPKARDVERQADLRNLQTAIEQFKQKNGRYPTAGCALVNGWSIESSACPEYVTGLIPDFLSNLPHDKKRTTNRGFAYSTNADGSVYKVAVLGTVESETVTNTHSMKRCDTSGLCAAYDDTVTDPCSQDNTLYKKTYALWGGYANENTDALVRSVTAATICR
jgi:prepilin-type N-terminal cleavage/methylation domain-containing protein